MCNIFTPTFGMRIHATRDRYIMGQLVSDFIYYYQINNEQTETRNTNNLILTGFDIHRKKIHNWNKIKLN